ncbi:hypothetical protein A9798_06990 [Edwardsiella hoshinae]|uniref:diguanylate cyclase n=1 Tax=Edwardsiella hoshinae TaxID=93378 RepID=A0ABN4T2P4_9GAMM|nr:hypothetical protein A9798_06990 [Edwardsiella hoshinae]
MNPIGFTNQELGKNFDAGTAELFAQCHDLEIAYKFNEKINNRIINYKDKTGRLCYFDILKFKVCINGEDYIFSIGKDVTDMYSKLTLYKHKAARDVLTGLLNRSALDEIGVFNNSVFIYIDLDNFKKVNDCYGHVTGDNILVRFSQLLLKVFSVSNGIVARIGGDEFLVIIKEVASEANVKNHLREVRALFNAEFGDYTGIGFDFSLGYCRFSHSIEHTLVEVDGLMYKDKSEKQC